ncbi:MAG: TonB-dependent receptor domain-containing protein [Luteibaculaceae bacterium]
MKTVILSILMAFSFTYSFAQTRGTLTGTVKDDKGGVLIGANVYLPKTSIGGVTDVNGVYSFTLPTGRQRVVVSLLGFGERVYDVTIVEGSTTTLDAVLRSSATDLETVVVTGTFGTRTQKETPMSMTVINSERLQQFAANSQADILRTVPGITAEGGGGEIASNVFIRGLPSGGQYQFTPVQIDGMPVLSSFGLNTSAHDVYFRNDLGFENLEFVRGGISTLFGAGSVAGIINYKSKTGSKNPENTVMLEWADQGRYKADFFNSGKLGNSENTFFAIAGTYRYDEGPLRTGLPSEGVQIRGNIKKVMENSTLTISGQFIDDVAQFFLPLPLNGSDRSRALGNNGNEIFSLQTNRAADIGYRTPDGFYQSPIRNGSKTRGGFAMVEYDHNLGNGFVFNSKVRYSRYAHEFNLFLDGPGVGNITVESQQAFAERVVGGPVLNPQFTFADNGAALAPTDLLFENRILDRIRPMDELSGEFNLTKKVEGKNFNHHITLGTFVARTRADDFNVTTGFLGEFNDQPRMVNFTFQDADGNTIIGTRNGLSNAGLGYINRLMSSAKQAVYLTNEIKGDRWNFDIGVRVENNVGNITAERTAQTLLDPFAVNTISRLTNGAWGTGEFRHARLSTSSYAVALGALYKLSDDASLYGNFSSGYFFPELRAFNPWARPDGLLPEFSPERINQGEIGVKYGKNKFSGTFAAYYVGLNDRRQVEFVNQPDGSVFERVALTSTQTVGVEATWNYYITKHLSFMGNFTYQHHELTQFDLDPTFEGNWLFRQPRLMGMAGLFYNDGKWDGMLTNNYMGKKYTNNNNTIELDPYNLWRLDAGYRFKMSEGKSAVRVGFAVFNLFNSVGITEGSPRLGDGQEQGEFFVGRPELPRRFFVRVRFDF